MRHRSTSPLSQYQVTRVQEKVNLQNLNDRLAAYIDKVRHLEEDNVKLQTVISTYTDKQEKQFKQIKSIYDEELKEARRTLDELAKERAKIDIEARKYKADYDDTALRLNRKEREYSQLEKHAKDIEEDNYELKSKYEKMFNEAGRRLTELNELKLKVSELERQLSDTRRQLEEETLLRVDAENQNVSLKEDLQFKNQVHREEVEQIRSEKRVEVQEVDRIKEEYDNNLIIELNRIRNDTDQKIREMREEVEQCYDRKLRETEEALKRSDTMLDQIRGDLTSSRNKIAELNSENNRLQRKSVTDEEKIRKLEDKLADNQHKDNDANQYRDNQLRKIQDEYNNLCVDYQSLLDVKISLDQEISAYRKLLESEESRLQLSSPSRPEGKCSKNDNYNENDSLHKQSSSTIEHIRNSKPLLMTTKGGGSGSDCDISICKSNRSFKELESKSPSYLGDSILTRSARKRRFEEQVQQSNTSSSYSTTCNSSGAIQIIEEDNDEGLYLTIYNTSTSSVNISGWIVRRQRVLDDKSSEFRFPASTILRKEKSSVIWSSRRKSFVSITPPDSFVLSFQEWPTGDHTITTVIDSNGQEVCRRESIRRVERSQSTRSMISKSMDPIDNAGNSKESDAKSK